MAIMKNCFQVSTVSSSARGGVLQSFHLEKIHFPTYSKALNSSNLSFSSSSSSLFPHLRSRTHKSPFVSKAALDEVEAVTDATWETLVVGSDIPVLVEFWAPWCGPCRMIAPIINELAKEYAGKFSCLKVNTDDCPNIANKFGIRSIPTVLFFKNGEKKESVIGAVPKATLSSTIDKYIDA